MKKSSMIFKTICLAVAAILCLSMVSVLAEEAVETEESAAEEIVADVEEDIEIVTEAEEVAEDEEAENEEEEIEEAEVLDLFAATLRDGGVYVTPGDYNAAVFTYDNVRYKVNAGEGNLIKLDGFESGVNIEESIGETAKNRLQANGEIAVEAAHSGYFGLAVSAGDVIYRTAVTEGDIYVFSGWFKMPSNGSISDDEDRKFKVVGEDGSEYVVGYNEIGREVDATGSWQQVIFTFKAPVTGLFEIDFGYTGKSKLYIDDLELYTAEVFDNPLSIESTECTDANGNSYTYSTGFTTSGTLTHTTVLYNSDEDDVFFNAIMVLYKNDIMIDFECIEECALVLDETEVTFEIEIPEDEDLSQYKYMVYFISDTNPTQYYGKMPSVTNPYVVEGK